MTAFDLTKVKPKRTEDWTRQSSDAGRPAKPNPLEGYVQASYDQGHQDERGRTVGLPFSIEAPDADAVRQTKNTLNRAAANLGLGMSILVGYPGKNGDGEDVFYILTERIERDGKTVDQLNLLPDGVKAYTVKFKAKDRAEKKRDRTGAE